MSRLAVCPVCQGSFHRLLIAEHAAQCTGPLVKRPRTHQPPAQPLAECPLCGVRMPAGPLLEAHAATCCPTPPKSTQPARRPTAVPGASGANPPPTGPVVWFGLKRQPAPAPNNWGKLREQQAARTQAGGTGGRLYMPHWRGLIGDCPPPGFGTGASQPVPGFGLRDWGRRQRLPAPPGNLAALAALSLEPPFAQLLPDAALALARQLCALSPGQADVVAQLVYSTSVWVKLSDLGGESVPEHLVALADGSAAPDPLVLHAHSQRDLEQLWSSRVAKPPKEQPELATELARLWSSAVQRACRQLLIREPCVRLARDLTQPMLLIHRCVLAGSGLQPGPAAALVGQTQLSGLPPAPTTQVAFSSADQFASWADAVELHDQFETAVGAGKTETVYAIVRQCADRVAAARPEEFGDSWRGRWRAEAVAARVVWQGIRLLERDKRFDGAGGALEYIELLLASPTVLQRAARSPGELHERRVTDLKHLKRPTQALAACVQALDDQHVRGSCRLEVQARYAGLAVPPRVWKPRSFEPLCPFEVSEVEGERREDGRWEDGQAGCSVEAWLLAKRLAPGWRGGHLENGLAVHLFGLLVLADRPTGQLQPAPLELGQPHFGLPPQVLASVQGELEEAIRMGWQAAAGRWVQGVDRVRWGLEETVELGLCVGGRVVAGMLEAMAEDYQGCCGGLPDLLLWKPGEGLARWIEVKGPGDSLRPNQRVWLSRLVSLGASVEVVHVTTN